MNIYKVTVPEELIDGDYDVVEGIVVFAVDEMSARETKPAEWSSWAVAPLRLIVELIGTGEGADKQIILMSYRAG